MQILPVIVTSEYTDPVAEKDIMLLNESLKVLGKLCSLVFVRNIESYLTG